MVKYAIVAVAFLAAVVLAAWSAWKEPGWKGILKGSGALWGYVLLSIALSIAVFGADGPSTATMVGWLGTGWAWSLLFCWVIAAIRKKLGGSKKKNTPP